MNISFLCVAVTRQEPLRRAARSIATDIAPQPDVRCWGYSDRAYIRAGRTRWAVLQRRRPPQQVRQLGNVGRDPPHAFLQSAYELDVNQWRLANGLANVVGFPASSGKTNLLIANKDDCLE